MIKFPCKCPECGAPLDGTKSWYNVDGEALCEPCFAMSEAFDAPPRIVCVTAAPDYLVVLMSDDSLWTYQFAPFPEDESDAPGWKWRKLPPIPVGGSNA